jgi:hypothetical protein
MGMVFPKITLSHVSPSNPALKEPRNLPYKKKQISEKRIPLL